MQSWGGLEWANWSQYTSQEDQSKEYQLKAYQQKEYPPKAYQQKEYQPKEYSSKYYPPKDYQLKAYPQKLQQTYPNPKEYQNQPNQDCQSRASQLYPPRNGQGHVGCSSSSLNAPQHQSHGPVKYDNCLKKQQRHFDFPDNLGGQRTGMDVIGSQVYFTKASLTSHLSHFSEWPS